MITLTQHIHVKIQCRLKIYGCVIKFVSTEMSTLDFTMYMKPHKHINYANVYTNLFHISFCSLNYNAAYAIYYCVTTIKLWNFHQIDIKTYVPLFLKRVDEIVYFSKQTNSLSSDKNFSQKDIWKKPLFPCEKRHIVHR